MAITDLTGTKWRLNDYIPMDALANFGGHKTFRGTKYTVSFTSDYVSEHGQNYDELYGEANSGGTPTRYALRYKVGDVAVPGPYIVGEGYPSGHWHNEGAKTIEITGGEDATNTNLIAWLEANATQVFDNKYLDDAGLTKVAQILKGYFDEKASLSYVDGVTGDLTTLATTDKSAIVPAINEVNGKLGMNLEIGVEKWFGTYKEGGVTYQVYTKAIKIDALPDVAGITTYDHGISGIKQILQVYGFCTNGFVMNAPRQNAQDNITIYQVSKSATNQTLSIEVGKDRSSVGAYVVLVYAKNN